LALRRLKTWRGFAFCFSAWAWQVRALRRLGKNGLVIASGIWPSRLMVGPAFFFFPPGKPA
jgi:hypothetical protein